MTNSAQSVQDQTTYDPYGNTSDMGSSTNPFLYVGRELSDASGFYYMRSRYCSPGLGRFISRDPMGLAGGINMYAYAGDDPIDFSGATGLGYDWLPGPNLGYFGFYTDAFEETSVLGNGGWFGIGVGPGSALLQVLNRDGLDIRYQGQNGGGLGLNFGGNVVPVQQLGKGFPGPGWSRYFDRSYRRKDTPGLTLKPDLHRQKAIGPSFLLTWANERQYNQNIRLSGGEVQIYTSVGWVALESAIAALVPVLF